MDGLISLMQINVALGCLYNGLDVARYRAKLHDAIVLAVESVPEYADVVDDLDSDSSFANNSRLSEHHHGLRRWIYQLPAESQKKIVEDEKWSFDGPTSPEKLPWMYRFYFGKNWDRILVWLLSVIAPLFFIWMSVFETSILLRVWPLVFLGQLAPVVNIWLGRRMIRKVRRDVIHMLDELVSAHKERGVSPAIEKARQSIPQRVAR